MVSARLRMTFGVIFALLMVAIVGAGKAESVDPTSEGFEVRPSGGPRFTDYLPEGPPRQQTPEEAEREDTAAIAEASGWTFEEAERRLRFHEEVSELAARLRREYPDTLAAIWQENREKDKGFFVRFVGPVPQKAKAWAKELSLEVTFMEDGASSERELERRADVIHDSVRARGFENLASGAAAHLGRIELEITRPEGYRGGDRDDELRARLPQSARESDVTVTFFDEKVVESEQAIAGAWVGRNGSAHCTSGFVIRHDDVPRGVTTAAHCSMVNGALNQYQDPSTALLYPMTLLGSHFGQWGDVEWHQTSHPNGHRAWFYSNYGTTRRVHTVVSQFGFTVGQEWCMFGRASGRGCSTVHRTSQTCSDAIGEVRRIVVMDTHISEPRDSGGSWYKGHHAAGIHRGRCSQAGGGSSFSKTGLVARTPMSIDVVARDRKVRGERMNPDSSIFSPNGKHELRMQGDGNLVVYRLTDGAVIWATSQFGVPNVAGSFAVMQKQGNFVHYRPNGVAHWGTPAEPWGNRVLMQNDGNLVVYQPNEQARWAISCAAGGIGPC